MKRYLLLVLCLIIISGCGGGGGGVSAPSNATILINPSSLSVTDASASASTHTQFFTVTVKNSAGAALGDTKITISFPWAVPDSAGVVQLYDEDGNARNSPFDAKTDNFGTYNVRFDFMSGGGLKYTGNLEVRSGSAFGTSTVTIQ